MEACLLQEELGTPALAFVRTVTAVLGLDSSIEDEVAVLRRNLLRLVHVGEFSTDAVFRVGCMRCWLLQTGLPCHAGPGAGCCAITALRVPSENRQGLMHWPGERGVDSQLLPSRCCCCAKCCAIRCASAAM